MENRVQGITRGPYGCIEILANGRVLAHLDAETLTHVNAPQGQSLAYYFGTL